MASPWHFSRTKLAVPLLPPAPIEEGEQSLIAHPYLFALFPALSLVSDNVELLSIDKTILTIAMVTLIVTHMGLRLLILAGQDSRKASLLVSSTLLLFFSYGHVYQFVTKTLGGLGIRHRHALLAWAALAIAAFRYSLGERAASPAQTYFLNSVSSCLVALSLLQIGRHQLAPPGGWRFPRQPVSEPLSTRPAAAYPDVYYFILDSHASSISLSEIYDHDIGAFLQRLKNKGFYIAEKSCSNYAMTMLSLASSLNLDYLDALTGESSPAGKGLGLSKQLIENNSAMRFLMAMGYKTIFMGSGFSITQANRYAHVNIDCGNIDETVGRLVQSTLLRAFADRAQFIANDKRNRIRCLFSQLRKVHKLRGPKFVFAHIPCPQWPFLFDAKGNPTNRQGLDVEQKKEAYLNQLTFIDGEVEKLIDVILTGATVDPIIILQSDHGPNFALPDGYHLPSPPREVLREKMQIFNAIYLPDGGSDFLYPSISPVNIFRVIFSEYFGAKMPLLDDRSYFSTYEFPFRLLDVTNFVQID